MRWGCLLQRPVGKLFALFETMGAKGNAFTFKKALLTGY